MSAGRPAADRAAAGRTPAAADHAVIQLVPAIGDHVPAGGTLLNVYGSRELPGRRLRRAVVLGDERTIDDDPAFAIRMLVDVAIKALSPAVPEKRHPPLAGQSTLLDDAVASAIPRTQRAAALVPDRQGIGMSRRTPDDEN